MLSLLKQYFGYEKFRPLQQDIIENVLVGGDSLVLMPTGGGKSLCYQLPALKFEGLTLVISPLISLMKDQVDVLQANGIAAAFLNSTLSGDEISRIQQQARDNELKILYLAPERLMSYGFEEFLQSLHVSLIAIDEAHCISEWGHDFRPDYRNLKILRDIFPQVPVMALTATATPQVQKDIIGQLKLEQAKVFLASFNRPNLTYVVLPKRQTFDVLLELLEKYKDQSVIIYCFSRKDTEKLAADLTAEGFKTLAYHAGLTPKKRQRAQNKFIWDEVRIITATIAFGMGIDKPDVRLVVHYSMPKSVEGYYQETGRAGRDDLPSECVMFYSYGDKIKQDFFIRKIQNTAEQINAESKLDEMVHFCELQSCRRKFLLEYFGEKTDGGNCGACDSCLSTQEEFDATEITKKILSAVLRSDQRFGANHIIAILRGSKSKKILERGHEKLSVFGIVEDFEEEELKQIMRALLDREFLLKDDGKYPILSVSEKGYAVLKEDEQVTLPQPKTATVVKSSKSYKKLEYDEALFAKLRELRKELADERGVPPFVIFGDLTLQEMAYYLPQDHKNLLCISGVGQVKLTEFGDTFLVIISEYSKQHKLESRKIPARRNARSSRSSKRLVKRKGSTYDETKQLFIQKLTPAEIANQRKIRETTVIAHLEKIVAAGEEIDLDYLRSESERFQKIKEAFSQHGLERLSPVREVLGEGYSYNELRLVRVLISHES